MKVCLLVLVLLSTSSLISGHEGYYWRDYNGDIPNDAFQAGRDTSGKPIYIGQGFFLNTGLLPGTIHAGSTNIKVTAVQEVFNTDYVKILCSRESYNLRWVAIKYADIPHLSDYHLVNGGIETNSVVHIGRVRHEDNVEIGKVYNLAPYQGLAVPNRQGTETIYQTFDILVFSPNLIDTRFNVVE